MDSQQMIKCGSCTELAEASDVFGGLKGAVMGPWWFCDSCTESIENNLNREESL